MPHSIQARITPQRGPSTPWRPPARGAAGAAVALVALSALAGCDDEAELVVVPRCLDDSECEAGNICIDGECVPREALSCADTGKEAILQPGPPLIDFGFVGSGTAQAQLLIRNIGDCTLTIFEASLRDGSVSRFVCPFCSPEQFPIEIFPFRETEAQVFFTPPEVGVFEDELVVLSDDAEFPEIRIPVRARFDGVPALAVAPTAVDFDYAPVGQIVTRTVRLINQGTGRAPLLINGLSVESATASTFTVMPPITEPVELRPVRPGEADPESLDLTIRYKPAEVDNHVGDLVIATNEPGNGLVRVPLSGSSRTPAKIAISPDRLNFGPVPIGQTTSLPLTVINEGGTPLRVSTRWGGTGLSTDLSVSPQVLPPIAPGSFIEVAVFVTATSPGPITGILLLESNDPTQPSLPVPVAAEGQQVVGAQVLKIDMVYENGSSSSLDDDFRNVDMALENPFGLICDRTSPNPTDWGGFGNPSWLAFGPKEEPERIVLPDAMQDGTYRVLLTYQEDCESVPTGLVAAVLGITVETLIGVVTGSVGGGTTAGQLSEAISGLCLSRSDTSATVTVYLNGVVIAEVPTRLSSRGELVYAVDLVRNRGTFTVQP